MEGNKQPVIALTDPERFPLIGDLSFLNQLRQDVAAPVFNFRSGDRLTALHLEKVRKYEQRIRYRREFWKPGSTPEWLNDYLLWCTRHVPAYKGRSACMEGQPTLRRCDLAETPWSFVADTASLDDLLVYQTSGTTGAAMDVIFDPVTQACWLPQLESVLDFFGIALSRQAGKVAIALICSQLSTLTYASLSTYLEGAGILKINLNPAEWRDPAHRLQFLEHYQPEILTGDPFSLMDLLALQPALRPRALVSSAMKVTLGIRNQLESYFQCPVIDLYSLTECRMVAFAWGDTHRAIRPDLYLEVFDPMEDRLLPEGAHGELVITGGINPFLPLIRYRTGDFCKLEFRDGIPCLTDLEARKPVPFYTRSHQLVNNVDISRRMTHFSLTGFQLHQEKNYNLYFKGWSRDPINGEIQHALRELFGPGITIQVEVLALDQHPETKTVNYSSDFNY